MILVKVGGPLGGLLEAVYQPYNVEADVEIEMPVWPERGRPVAEEMQAYDSVDFRYKNIKGGS